MLGFHARLLAAAALLCGLMHAQILPWEQPRPVFVHVVMIGLERLDAVEQSFHTDLWLSVLWREPNVTVADYLPDYVGTASVDGDGSSGMPDYLQIEYDPSKKWDPAVELINGKDYTRPEFAYWVGVPAWAAASVNALRTTLGPEPPGVWVWAQARITGRFAAALSLQDFPFDAQNASIILESVVHTNTSVQFVPAEALDVVALPRSLAVIGWNRRGVEVSVSDYYYEGFAESYSRFTLKVLLQRDSDYYTSRIVVNVILLVLMAAGLSWLRADEPDRMAGLLALFATVVSFLFVITGSTPAVSYRTRLDSFINYSFATIFAFFVSSGILYVFYQTNAESARQKLVDAGLVSPISSEALGGSGLGAVGRGGGDIVVGPSAKMLSSSSAVDNDGYEIVSQHHKLPPGTLYATADQARRLGFANAAGLLITSRRAFASATTSANLIKRMREAGAEAAARSSKVKPLESTLVHQANAAEADSSSSDDEEQQEEEAAAASPVMRIHSEVAMQPGSSAAPQSAGPRLAGRSGPRSVSPLSAAAAAPAPAPAEASESQFSTNGAQSSDSNSNTQHPGPSLLRRRLAAAVEQAGTAGTLAGPAAAEAAEAADAAAAPPATAASSEEEGQMKRVASYAGLGKSSKRDRARQHKRPTAATAAASSPAAAAEAAAISGLPVPAVLPRPGKVELVDTSLQPLWAVAPERAWGCLSRWGLPTHVAADRVLDLCIIILILSIYGVACAVTLQPSS